MKQITVILLAMSFSLLMLAVGYLISFVRNRSYERCKDYQVLVDKTGQNLEVYDALKYIGTIPLDTTTALGNLIWNDNK